MCISAFILVLPPPFLSEMKDFYAGENDLELLSLLPHPNAGITSTIPGLSGTEAQTQSFMNAGQALLSTESHPQPLTFW